MTKLSQLSGFNLRAWPVLGLALLLVVSAHTAVAEEAAVAPTDARQSSESFRLDRSALSLASPDQAADRAGMAGQPATETFELDRSALPLALPAKPAQAAVSVSDVDIPPPAPKTDLEAQPTFLERTLGKKVETKVEVEEPPPLKPETVAAAQLEPRLNVIPAPETPEGVLSANEAVKREANQLEGLKLVDQGYQAMNYNDNSKAIDHNKSKKS